MNNDYFYEMAGSVGSERRSSPEPSAGADIARLYGAETVTNTIVETDFESGQVLRRLPSGDGGDGLAVFE